MEFLFSSKNRKLKKLRRRQLFWDTIGGLLGSTTLAAALAEGYYYFYEAQNIITYDEPQAKGNTYAIEMGTPNESTNLFYLRVYITLASIFLAISLVVRYIYERKIQILTLKAKGLWTDKFRFSYWLMIIEVFYALLFLPPRVNGVYIDSQTGVYVTTDMLITTLMTGRMYLIARTLYSYSLFRSEAAQDACRESHVISNFWFVFKCELKSNPFILVGVMLCILFFIFGFGLRQMEIPYMFISDKDWDFIVNGVWNIFLTVTTVGYGDIFPSTSLGRVFCVIAAMLGSFFTSLLVIAISAFFQMSLKERNSVFRIKRRIALGELKEEAATLIKWAWKYSFFVKQLRLLSESKANHIYYKMCTSYLKFKQKRQKMFLESEYAVSPVDREYYNVSNALSKIAKKTSMIMWDVRIFQEKLSLLEQRQQQIEKIAGLVHTMYTQIENVTRPYISSFSKKSKGSASSIPDFSLSEFGSLLKANSQECIQEIEQISAQIPYQELSMQVSRAFRFGRKEFIDIINNPRVFQRKDVRHSSRALLRVQKAHENIESMEAVRSGALLKALEPIFGKEKARTVFNEIKNADSRAIAKISSGLTDILKTIGDSKQGSLNEINSSRNGTPRDDSPLLRKQTMVLETLAPISTSLKKKTLILDSARSSRDFDRQSSRKNTG